MTQRNGTHGAMRLSDSPIQLAEDEPGSAIRLKSRWKVLIVDDEDDVHVVTKLALREFQYASRGLTFLHAHSRAEAEALLSRTRDISVALIDVVMETDTAGLDLVDHIRQHPEHNPMRIILRTGQPGQAPERSVVHDFDINDYKEKSELTATRLFTTVTTALRAYRNIVALDANRRGLEHVVEACARLAEPRDLDKFAQGLLEQVTALLHLDTDSMLCCSSSFTATNRPNDQHMRIIAGTGTYESYRGHSLDNQLDSDLMQLVADARAGGRSGIVGDSYVQSFQAPSGAETLLYVAQIDDVADLDRGLLELLGRNAGVVFDNICLTQEQEAEQREVVYLLGEAVETRSRETGHHVKRVAEISGLLATAIGLTANEVEILQMASPLHDLGKIGIPDRILNKPGKLTPEEWTTMQTHASLGYDMLSSSSRPVLQAGAIIAHEHHEKWDGSGYPHGKSGTEIHIYGRITALADVFDALGSERCYKKAWPMPKVLELLAEQRGKHFEPRLVDALIDHLDEVKAIQERYLDAVLSS